MIWQLSNRGDQETRRIADRHYNRQKPGTPQFVPPGRCCVLYAPNAFWVTSWPFAEYVKHRWPGAWVCSAFRREMGCELLAHEMIIQALAVTRYHLGEPPELGMVTFLNREMVKPIKVRGKLTWGRTWLLSGFEPDGETEGGLLAFRIKPENIPAPLQPLGTTNEMFSLAAG